MIATIPNIFTHRGGPAIDRRSVRLDVDAWGGMVMGVCSAARFIR